MDRKLLDYLPPVLREVLEFQAINGANEPEISLAWDALALVLANQFLETASAHGVSVWEKELGILAKNTDSLESRKTRIKALWNLEMPYTLPWLKNWLDGICGAGNHSENIAGYTLGIRLNCAALGDANELAALITECLKQTKPANIRTDFTFALEGSSYLRMGGALAQIVRLPIPALQRGGKS